MSADQPYRVTKTSAVRRISTGVGEAAAGRYIKDPRTGKTVSSPNRVLHKEQVSERKEIFLCLLGGLPWSTEHPIRRPPRNLIPLTTFRECDGHYCKPNMTASTTAQIEKNC